MYRQPSLTHTRVSRHHQAREAADAATHVDDPKLTKKEGKKIVEKKAELLEEMLEEVKASKGTKSSDEEARKAVKDTKSGKGFDSKASSKDRFLTSLATKKLALKAFFDTYESADSVKEAVTPLPEIADGFSFSAKFGSKSATYTSEKDEKAEKKANKAIKASVLAEEERKAAKEAENKATIVKGESEKAETKKDTAVKAAAKVKEAAVKVSTHVGTIDCCYRRLLTRVMLCCISRPLPRPPRRRRWCRRRRPPRRRRWRRSRRARRPTSRRPRRR